MPQVTHSPFLQALGYAIINSLWQFALLWLVYVLLNTLLNLSSHQKYVTGLLLQVSGFVAFIVTLIFDFNYYSEFAKIILPFHPADTFHVIPGTVVTAQERLLVWIIQLESLIPYLSIGYLALLVIFLIRLIRGYSATKAIKTQGLYKIELEWKMFVRQLAYQLGIKHKVRIYLSELIKTPLTIGFYKPLILIPLASINHLNTEQMEAVILHELAHIKRFDYLINLFLALIETALFFNPFMILISRHIKRERENCCDDWVLQFNYSATSYATALLQIATCQSPAYSLALKAADNKSALLNRIKRIIENKENTFFSYKYQLVAFALMITVLSTLVALSSFHASKSDNNSIAEAAAFNPMPATIGSSSIPGSTHTAVENKRIVAKDIFKHLNKPTDTSKVAGRPSKNKKTQISNSRLITTKLLPEELSVILPSNNEDEFAKAGLKEEINRPGAELGEFFSGQLAHKEQEIALAEENFKKLALYLLREKDNVFNEKQVIERMKLGLREIRAVKRRLASAKNAIATNKDVVKIATGDQIDNMLKGFPFNKDKLVTVSNELQTELEKVEIHLIELTKDDISITDKLTVLPGVSLNPAGENAAHSFSFEFSEKQQMKAISPKLLKATKKVERPANHDIKDGKPFINELNFPSTDLQFRQNVQHYDTIKI